MKKKSILLCFLMSAGVIVSAGAKAQSLVIKLTDDSQHNEALNTLQSLTFSSDDLLVNFNSGATDTYELSGIRKLYFNTVIGIGDTNLRPGNHMDICPNPGSTFITVKGIPADAGSLTFYCMDGRKVMTEKVISETAVIDVTRLQSGLYLIHAMGQTVKFVRQ